MREYAGRAAIGHVRYATCGANDRSYAQPFERHHGCKWKWFSIAFNGQLANFDELRDQLLKLADYHLTRNIDTEVIMHYLSYELRHDDQARPGGGLPQPEPAVRRGLQPRLLNAMGDMVHRPRSQGLSAAVLCPGRPAVRRRQRKRGPDQPRLPRHPIAGTGRDDPHSGQQDAASIASPTQQPIVALLLRVDLLRQRGQHAGRPQRLPVAGGPGQGTGPAGTPAGQGAARRGHHRGAGARHGQGRRRRHGLRAGPALGRRADAQSLHRPDVHRRAPTAATGCA